MEGEDHPLSLDEILDETNQLDSSTATKQWLVTEALSKFISLSLSIAISLFCCVCGSDREISQTNPISLDSSNATKQWLVTEALSKCYQPISLHSYLTFLLCVCVSLSLHGEDPGRDQSVGILLSTLCCFLFFQTKSLNYVCGTVWISLFRKIHSCSFNLSSSFSLFNLQHSFQLQFFSFPALSDSLLLLNVQITTLRSKWWMARATCSSLPSTSATRTISPSCSSGGISTAREESSTTM